MAFILVLVFGFQFFFIDIFNFLCFPGLINQQKDEVIEARAEIHDKDT